MEWKDAKRHKPEINQDDRFDKEQKTSKKVLVYYHDNRSTEPEAEFYSHYTFGKYYHESGHWVLENFMGFDQNNVIAFAELVPPYGNLFKI